jgi:uncharacterized protein YdeI (YjbR/CyaY-like superfamily)
MGGIVAIPFRRSNREAPGLEGGETIEVRIALDHDERVVTPPRDLVAALKAAPPAWERWGELSYSHQREHAEAVTGARKPETRARRIAAAVQLLQSRPARKRRASARAL